MGDVKYQTEEGSEGYSLTVADKEILSNYTQCTNFIQIRFYPAFPISDITKGAWGQDQPLPLPNFSYWWYKLD